MKRKIVSIMVGTIVLLFLILAGRYGFTEERISVNEGWTMSSEEKIENAIQAHALTPFALVDGIWDSRIIPTFDEQAVELLEILSAITPNANGIVPKEELIAVTEKYGLITDGEAHVYMVRGSGRIVSVNTEHSQGTAEVALNGYEGPIKVLLYIGPRIPGNETTVRDAVGFIKFAYVPEATWYGRVAREINERVLTSVLGGIDRESLTGKTITFKGAFEFYTVNLTQIEIKEIHIVPVEIELGE